MGIKPELLPDLFQPFRQGDNSLDRNLGGLGLGLDIVKGMVELHGGCVTVSSEELGKGSKFAVHFPLFLGNKDLIEIEKYKL